MTWATRPHNGGHENPVNGITTTTVANTAFRVPYVGYSPTGLQISEFNNYSNYNSLQLTVRKQVSHGLTIQGAYGPGDPPSVVPVEGNVRLFAVAVGRGGTWLKQNVLKRNQTGGHFRKPD